MADQEPTFYLLKRRLDSRETPLMLGRIVRQFYDPTNSYTPENPSLIFPKLQHHIQETYDHDVTILANASRDSSLVAKLQGLLDVSAARSRHSEISVESPLITTRRLKDLDTVWAALKADTTIAARVVDMLRSHGKAFLVVGVMTICVGSIQRTGMRQSEQSTSVYIPVGAAAAAAGVFVAPDVYGEIKASHSNAVDWSMKGGVGRPEMENPEEEVFAVEYKVLKRDWAWRGKDIKMQSKVPDYKGGSTYAGDEDDAEDEDDDDHDDDQSASRAKLDEVVVVGEDFFSGAIIAGQKPLIDATSRFVYYP